MSIQCKKCKEIKNECFFSKNKKGKNGFLIYCKKCEQNRSAEYREKNKERIKILRRVWRQNNPEKCKEYLKKYLSKNPHMTSVMRHRENMKKEEYKEKIIIKRKEFYIKNKEKQRERRKIYYYNNKKKEREKNNKFKNKFYKENPFERMKKNLRSRIREFLTEENKSKRTMEVVGLTKEQFIEYIENKFVEDMSWDNYGKWHLDHIIPLCTANTEEEFIKLNHYTNLQPLWAIDNIRKNRKYGN